MLSKKGEVFTPKGTRRNRRNWRFSRLAEVWMSLTLRKQVTFQSSSLRSIWWNAFYMSAVTATSHSQKFIKIATMSSARVGPLWTRSFKLGIDLALAETSYSLNLPKDPTVLAAIWAKKEIRHRLPPNTHINSKPNTNSWFWKKDARGKQPHGVEDWCLKLQIQPLGQDFIAGICVELDGNCWSINPCR